MHPTDGELLLSAEPSDHANGQQVRAHLASCASCAARLQALLADLDRVAASFQVLDGTTPEVVAGSVIERAARRGRGVARAAAVLAMLAVAGAAAAFPGSPVRRWFAQQAAQERRGELPAPVQTAPAADAPAGVALAADGPLDLILPESVVEGTVALVRASDELVRVRSQDPATGFSFGPGSLTLDTRATDLELEVAAPTGLERLVVRVGEQILFARDLPFAADALPAGDTLRVSLRRNRP